MSRQIIKQPNGLYAVWSSIVNDFILTDVLPGSIIDLFVQEHRRDITERVSEVIRQLNCGEKPYFQFTLSYEKCLQIIKEKNNV